MVTKNCLPVPAIKRPSNSTASWIICGWATRPNGRSTTWPNGLSTNSSSSHSWTTQCTSSTILASWENSMQTFKAIATAAIKDLKYNNLLGILRTRWWFPNRICKNVPVPAQWTTTPRLVVSGASVPSTTRAKWQMTQTGANQTLKRTTTDNRASSRTPAGTKFPTSAACSRRTTWRASDSA